MSTDNKDTELWVDIVGYEGLYALSSYGNIKSLNYRGKTKVEKQLILREDKDGYLTVALCKKSVVCNKKVHRLVGLHFIDNPNNFPEINHKYGDKKNNYYKDLEWTTRLDNIRHSYKSGLKPRTTEKQKNAVRKTNELKKKPVYQYSLVNILIGNYSSLGLAADATHVDMGNISSCCLGKTKTAGGFIWSYIKL